MVNQFSMKFTPMGSPQRITSMFGSNIPKWFRPDLFNKNTLLKQILYRRYKGMNTFVLILGNVRSGKSWGGIKFCELYDPSYDVSKSCSFTIPKFLRWSSENMDSTYLVDEIQLSMGAREWYTLQHRVFNQFCDIQGFRRNCAFFTLPNISYIDKHIRFLINYVMVTITQGLIAWYKVKTLHHLGKAHLEFGGTYRMSKPTKRNTTIYEAMKKKYNDQHLKESLKLLDNMGIPTKKQVMREKNLELTIALKEQRLQKFKNKNNNAYDTDKLE